MPSIKERLGPYWQAGAFITALGAAECDHHGGATLDGYTHTLWWGAVLAVLGLGLPLFAAWTMERRK